VRNGHAEDRRRGMGLAAQVPQPQGVAAVGFARGEPGPRRVIEDGLWVEEA
jgi:hypothetical protein